MTPLLSFTITPLLLASILALLSIQEERNERERKKKREKEREREKGEKVIKDVTSPLHQ
jgi:hypothetical protein